ncbi:complement factor H-related protein 2-like [Bufo gargarizans]|uniref:complement factor H-related protein 2-like n=1 Tax=Bufo gargarizans TaxID=30331 RepID=UPI001CF24EFD|nr:complement factor H-related protein 2-like [Bufo gargarizans]
MAASGFYILLLFAMSCCAAPNPEKDHCEKPEQIKRAQLQGEWHDETYPPGKVANFVCLPEYTQDGPIKMACIEGIWWHIAKGQCKESAKQCGPPPSVQFADTVEMRKRTYNSGEFVKYRCPEYYTLEGIVVVRCLNGVWDETPACREPCITNEKDMEENNIQQRWIFARKIYIKHGDMTEFTCKAGYETSPDTQMRIPCQQGKLEYPKCIKREPCITNEKDMEENNIQQRWIFARKIYIKHGDMTEFTCKAGYETSPDTQMRIPCQQGKLEYPKCIKRGTGAQCGPPPNVQYGDTLDIRKANYKSGEKVEFRCPEYYILEGNRFVTCFNGVWSSAPVCLEPCTAKERDMESNNIQLKWRSDRKIYSRHGEIIEFICKPGYEAPPDTQMRITCNQGNLEYPKCFKRGTCRIVQDDLDENNLELDEVHDNEVFYAEGEVIQYKCKNGFEYRGRPTGICSEQALSYPKCTESSK